MIGSWYQLFLIDKRKELFAVTKFPRIDVGHTLELAIVVADRKRIVASGISH